MALTFIAGAVATAIIDNLVKTCFSYIKAHPGLRGVRDELERLELALPQIQTVLTAIEEAASIAEQNKELDTWLWQLRDAVENAEDVLDELDYYELKKTIKDRDDKQQEHFQAVQRLDIKQCENLEYFPTDFFGKFNAIKSLRVVNCPKLTKRGISDIQVPSVLDELTIGSCGGLEAPLLWSADLTSLTRLNLLDCASITSLPPAEVCARWTMLSGLQIYNCKELSSLGGIQALVSLRRLIIEGCDKLIDVALLLQPLFPNDVGQKKNAVMDCFLKNGSLSIDHHALLLMEPLRSLSSIRELTLYGASQLTSLPDLLLQNHTALEDLVIKNASSLQSLPDLPTSLRHLHITRCHPVLEERCRENIGPDWPKIAHIPWVRIE